MGSVALRFNQTAFALSFGHLCSWILSVVFSLLLDDASASNVTAVAAIVQICVLLLIMTNTTIMACVGGDLNKTVAKPHLRHAAELKPLRVPKVARKDTVATTDLSTPPASPPTPSSVRNEEQLHALVRMICGRPRATGP